MEINNKQVNSLFADIRTAHRLIYEYQKRVLDLIFYIKGKLKFPDRDRVGGYKRFSDAIGKTRAYSDSYGKANLAINDKMLAWDFLYSYIMEFNLGEIEESKHAFSMSIIEISDTGYYSSHQQNRDQQDIQTFANIEDSSTMLIFVFETTKNKTYQLWDTSEEKIREWILSTKTCLETRCNNDVFLIMKVPMHRLTNKENVDIVISEFNDFVKETTGIDLIN